MRKVRRMQRDKLALAESMLHLIANNIAPLKGKLINLRVFLKIPLPAACAS